MHKHSILVAGCGIASAAILLASAALAGSKGSGKPQNLMRKSSSTGSATKLRVRNAGRDSRSTRRAI